MGKGDQRSRRGKIWRGTFGKRRPRKGKLASGPSAAAAPAEEKKGRAKKEAESGE
jgi:30S ribosomal protein S31